MGINGDLKNIIGRAEVSAAQKVETVHMSNVDLHKKLKWNKQKEKLNCQEPYKVKLGIT